MSEPYDKIGEYIEGLYAPVSEELERLRRTGEEGHIPIILKDTETLIGVILEMKKPKNVLEIGTAIGYSASYISEILSRIDAARGGAECGPVRDAGCRAEGSAQIGAEKSMVTTMEVDPLYYADAEKNLAERNNVRLLLGDAVDLLRDSDETYDLVFIDAAKSKYADFWEAVMPHVEAGAVIICDNVMMKGKTADPSVDTEGRFVTNIKYMRKFLEKITNDERVVTSVISAGDGMSISVVK